MKSSPEEQKAEIRQQAEVLLSTRLQGPLGSQTQQSLEELLHELAVHQIELDMQNTELSRTEERLETARKKYAELYNFAPVGYFRFDKKGKILEANPAGARLLGVKKNEGLRGRIFYEFCEKESTDPFYLHLRRVMKSRKPERSELVLLKDGKPFDAVIESVAVHDEQGNFSLCQSALLDITDRKRGEAELRQAHDFLEERVRERTADLAKTNQALHTEIVERQRVEDELKQYAERLADADRRKDEFLAMLAHELRNPLAPVRNAVAVLQYAGSSDPRLQRQSEIIDRQVTHMARLLDDLLDVSRITRGKIALQTQPLHLTDVLAHAIETVTPMLHARKHTLHVTEPPDELLVEGDLDRLAQVVDNLLMNALKYTNEGGEIWLEAKREDDQAIILVRDNGMGIGPEMLPDVFDLFTQADRTRGHAQGGLGIGLTMVRRLVQMHGGSVEALSAGLGYGSEFIVRLPALPANEALSIRRPAARKQSGKQQSRRILVVDDMTDTAESLAELLRLWGHDVHAAHSGLSALEAVRQVCPEVVLLDIGMPGMDGFEVAQHLRQEHPNHPLMLVALTGYAQESDRIEARQAGFDAHLSKPVDLEALRELLAQPTAGPS